MSYLNMRLYDSTANFTKVEKIAIQWIALSGLRTTDPRTLRRRRHESGTFSDFAFSSMPDNQLDSINAGNSGDNPLLSRGLRVQRRRVESSISRVDPITSSLRDSQGEDNKKSL